MEKFSLNTFPKWGALALIRGYQIGVGPFLGAACRFEPTCSQYSLEAIQHYGFLKGTTLMVRRLLKCHPFHPGGKDSFLK